MNTLNIDFSKPIIHPKMDIPQCVVLLILMRNPNILLCQMFFLKKLIVLISKDANLLKSDIHVNT